MQLSFRLDKRPGESHLALDGKKFTADSTFGFHIPEEPNHICTAQRPPWQQNKKNDNDRPDETATSVSALSRTC